jgi:hypothetical protein
MTKLQYHGGFYDGQVTPERRKQGRRARRRLVPHGVGTLSFKNDVTYTGFWRYGYEHGNGTIRWATGEEYIGCFMYGSPDPRILRVVYKSKRKLKRMTA